MNTDAAGLRRGCAAAVLAVVLLSACSQPGAAQGKGGAADKAEPAKKTQVSAKQEAKAAADASTSPNPSSSSGPATPPDSQGTGAGGDASASQRSGNPAAHSTQPEVSETTGDADTRNDGSSTRAAQIEASRHELLWLAIVAGTTLTLLAFAGIVLLMRRVGRRCASLEERLQDCERTLGVVGGVRGRATLAERLSQIDQRIATLTLRIPDGAAARPAAAAHAASCASMSLRAAEPHRPAVNAHADNLDYLGERVPQRNRAEAMPSSELPIESSGADGGDVEAIASSSAMSLATVVNLDDPAALHEFLVAIQHAADAVLADGKVRDAAALTGEIGQRLSSAHAGALESRALRVGAHGASSGPDFHNPYVLSVGPAGGNGWLVPNRRANYAYSYTAVFDGDGAQWPEFLQPAACVVDGNGQFKVTRRGKL